MLLTADSAIDLQLHTTYSDGAWEPAALLDYLIGEGFSAAAITDHDRVDTTATLQALARDKGFLLLPAVEMSTHWRDLPVDMLCYGFDPQNAGLHALAASLLHLQQDNIRKTVAAIAGQSYPLPDDDVQIILQQPSVQQPHSLVRLLKEQGYDLDERSAGRVLLDAGLEIITLALDVVVQTLHQSGGVCLIAHPGRGDGYMQFDETLLDQLRAETPIDGFEVYYPAHSPEQIALYRAYAEKHGLLTSAGSDSHAPDKPPIKYPAASSRNLLERLGVQIV
jgi:predicted metal-dependent phosphoesterase TrpH